MKQYNNGAIHAVFFGTHDFAATMLQALFDDPRISVELVVTQPDKLVGREQKLTEPPVKALAIKNNIAFEQPSSLKTYHLSPITYHLGVTAQYGLLIPTHIFTAFPLGILNVHTSLLPKYRGASPIQSALINGETETGVTIMKMDEGLDTGPILLQQKVPIDADETYPMLEQKLAPIAAKLLLDAIPKYVSGELAPVPQDNSQATFCRELTRDDGRIDWNRPAREIYNQYRGMTPWPGVWTMWGGKRLKLLRIAPVETQDFGSLPPGRVRVEDDRIHIGCTTGAIEVFELQLEGKKEIAVKIFLRGYRSIDHGILA